MLVDQNVLEKRDRRNKGGTGCEHKEALEVAMRPPVPTNRPASPNKGGERILFEFVHDDCRLCHKAPAEIDGLCITCDHLQDDLRIDQSEGSK